MNFNKMLFYVLIGCFVAFIGCDIIGGNDDDNDNDQSVEGLWELTTNNETTYVLVEEESITVYTKENSLDCFYIETFDIVSVDNDVYTLFIPDAQENQDVTIVRDGDEITVTRMEDGETVEEVFEKSDANVSGFTPECEETISGLWQLDSDQGDIFYVFIDLNDDSVILADYRGDSVNQGGDCYEFHEFIITATNGNDYTLENASNSNEVTTVTIEIVNGDLEVTREDNNQQINERYFRSNEDPSSFQPECSEE